MQRFLKMSLVMALVSANIAFAEVSSQSKDIVVSQPKDLPEAAQIAGQSMVLHAFGNGRTYLYIEQQQLGRLAILDVTDPSRIKSVASATLDIPSVFDFARPLGDSAILVCFRDHKGSAVLDLRSPKNPALSPASALLQGTHTEEIGANGFLMLNGLPPGINSVAQDYRIVDSTNPQKPELLDTVEKVQKKLVNEDTGTLFLLGESGLTVVRQPAVEEELRAESSYTN
jgi:hypothetical protein